MATSKNVRWPERERSASRGLRSFWKLIPHLLGYISSQLLQQTNLHTSGLQLTHEA